MTVTINIFFLGNELAWIPAKKLSDSLFGTILAKPTPQQPAKIAGCHDVSRGSRREKG